jgi:histidinol-phosphate/aromatic aminotransferase/cobyric acid decarboxylase-like protein
LALCEKFSDKALIVIDEAYIDFADAPSLSHYIDQFENLAILRTFSKAHGMAGARLGLVLANENLIQWLLKIIAPYPLPMTTTHLLEKALKSDRLLKTSVQISMIKSERLRVFEALQQLSVIEKVWPSQTNYLLAKTLDSDKIMKACADKGIIIRSMFDKKGLENCIRITIGLPEENSELINTLREVSPK